MGVNFAKAVKVGNNYAIFAFVEVKKKSYLSLFCPSEYLDGIYKFIKENNIPDQLVINWEQTGMFRKYFHLLYISYFEHKTDIWF